ncbi:magnesium transporter MRS2-F-like [Rhododendron vialii]|uniref:magnesium transporter MRS2-F-like n=1 Tax=Rhododendron vialii TaxID=182163 RepID=UPI00265F2476|nr:magnesium transporter MRS2-F-like [Rhododendron vialii]
MRDQIELSRRYIPLLPSQSRAKRKGAGSRTWLVVSKSGQVSVEELGKQTVMRQNGITARDLRVVEPELSYPSTILRRERAAVVNLEHIKAIVTANEVLVPNPRDPRIASFVYDLEFKLSDFVATMRSDNSMEQSPTDTPPEASGSRCEEAPADQVDSRRGNSKPLPFEFRALEICLESVCKSLESETLTLEEEAYPALDQLSAKTSTNNLKRVRVIKGRLVALNGRVQKVRNEFEHLLDDDIDMAQMYLTDKLATLQSEGLVPEDEIDDDEEDVLLAGGAIDGNMSSKSSTVAASDLKPNVEELEMLLGAYFVQIEGILNKLSTLHEYVRNTEDYINIVLDDKQNQLLRMGLLISMATFMITLAEVAFSFLSMNIGVRLLVFGTYTQWFGAVGGCLVCSVFLYIVVILVLKWFRFLG